MLLGLVVRQSVERLQDGHTEHQHGVPGRPSPVAAVGSRQGCLKLSAEGFEIHHGTQPLLRIEEPRLSHYPRLRQQHRKLISLVRVGIGAFRGAPLRGRLAVARDGDRNGIAAPPNNFP